MKASIDYLRVDGFPDRPVLPKSLRAKTRFSRRETNPAWLMTVHDPAAEDIVALVGLLGDAHIDGLEIAVDFWPRPGATSDNHALLNQTFFALAARFRPDDELIHGAGLKAGFGTAGGRPVPIHTRLPQPHETLVYSHRDEGHNAKLYLKRRDQGLELPPDRHRVRLETTITSFGGFELEFKRLSDVFSARIRSTFAKVFRIVDRPEVRRPSRLSAERLGALETKLATAWGRAGVNSVEQPPLPSEASMMAKEASKGRPGLVRLADVRLRRDPAANGAIGEALRALDRRLTRAWKASRFSGHARGVSAESKVSKP